MFSLPTGRYKIAPKRPEIKCGPGRTKQSMRDQTNINLIMAKYQKTGMVSFVNKQQGEYMNTDPIDFQEAMDMIVNANNMFAEIPSSVRKRFGNDPKEFFEFLHNPENVDELISLGLATPPPEPPAIAPSDPPDTSPPGDDL